MPNQEGIRRRAAELGRRGEDLIATLLRDRGFEILARNQRVGSDEIDIIAGKARLLVFCEVRSRSSARFMDPLESIGQAKVARIRRAARRWLDAAPIALRSLDLRFDVAAVILESGSHCIDYLEDAF